MELFLHVQLTMLHIWIHINSDPPWPLRQRLWIGQLQFLMGRAQANAARFLLMKNGVPSLHLLIERYCPSIRTTE